MISTYLIATAVIAVYQLIFPEALITCIVPTLIILGTYLNQENPLFSKLKRHHDEMVIGFATLVENRDDNTGGHIYRTTAYVRILAEKLREKKYYGETLTRDYLESLVTAAPLHDVGKIAIPDAILQKPGRLTPEEFDIMKTHAKRGGEIIQKTLGKEDEYLILWRCIITKNGTERVIPREFPKRKYRCARELWLSRTCSTRCPQSAATRTRYRLKSALR